MTTRVNKSLRSEKIPKIEAQQWLQQKSTESCDATSARETEKSKTLPVNLWVTAIVDCSMLPSNRFIPKKRLSHRHSWDFPISSDCRQLVSFQREKSFHHAPHTEHSSRTANIYKRLVHKPINLLITYFSVSSTTSRRYFYWITWRCVNKFSLRATTLNSSRAARVAYEKSW